MKIVVDNAIPFIEGRFPENVEVVYLPGDRISPKAAHDADGIIVRTRTKCDESLLKFSKVKLVATATIGTDHIDLEWCERNGVAVRNAPGCNAPGVAQYVLASLFETGFNPQKDVLGIIGYGHVGSIVAKWARELGIRVLISDDPRKESGFSDVDYLDIEEVLRNSDAVTLHVPLTKSGSYPTYKMIGERQLLMMKPGAMIVNSSRGGVVDEKALKDVVKQGKVKTIVDVWENEPYIDSELVMLAEIATPHIAGYSAQGKKRATLMALKAVEDVLGVPVDLSGLDTIPVNNESLSRELIEKSYDPKNDTIKLRADIKKFENLRNAYAYRDEPLFYISKI